MMTEGLRVDARDGGGDRVSLEAIVDDDTRYLVMAAGGVEIWVGEALLAEIERFRPWILGEENERPEQAPPGGES
jgi:hypothetical protein